VNLQWHVVSSDDGLDWRTVGIKLLWDETQ